MSKFELAPELQALLDSVVSKQWSVSKQMREQLRAYAQSK